ALLPWLGVRYLAGAALGWLEYIGAWIAVLTHLLLDWTNVYGIRLLLPFSDRWLRLGITDIVDPWILSILLVAIAPPALVKLGSDEIGGRNAPPPRRAWAVFALIAVASYESFRYVSHERALNMLASHLYGDAPPARVTALPDRINPTRWRGIVEGGGEEQER